MLNRHIDSIIERHYATTSKAMLLTSGKDYQRHIALNNLLTNAEYNIRRAIVFSNENVSVAGNVLYVPVYMTMFLHYRKSEGPIIYHPELP